MMLECHVNANYYYKGFIHMSSTYYELVGERFEVLTKGEKPCTHLRVPLNNVILFKKNPVI